MNVIQKTKLRYRLSRFLAAGMVICSSILVGCTDVGLDRKLTEAVQINDPPPARFETVPLADQWGIEIVALRSTAAGHMLDFRYKVLDTDKAAPLFKRGTRAYLLHQSTGKALAVPNTAKLGRLRTTNQPQQGRTYWMFFGNHHGLVKTGDLVTVNIGDFTSPAIIVQ